MNENAKNPKKKFGCGAGCAVLALGWFLLTVTVFALKPYLLNLDGWSPEAEKRLETRCGWNVPEGLRWQNFQWRAGFRDEWFAGEFSGTREELERFFPKERFLYEHPEDIRTVAAGLPMSPEIQPERTYFTISGRPGEISLCVVAEELPDGNGVRVWFRVILGSNL